MKHLEFSAFLHKFVIKYDLIFIKLMTDTVYFKLKHAICFFGLSFRKNMANVTKLVKVSKPMRILTSLIFVQNQQDNDESRVI